MILKNPINIETCSRHLLFTSAARKAWGHLLNTLNEKAPCKVLLPSYIGFTEREGSGVFDPIEETSTLYDFYPIRQDLTVDLEKFEGKLKTGQFQLVLIIHYFGFCRNDMSSIVSICKENNVLLVEDCAHAFQLGLDNQQLGVIGDFSFYSLHKYLATDSGGILQINTSSIIVDAVPEVHKPALSVVEQYARTDIKAVAEKRRANYLNYQFLLQDVQGIAMMYRLEDVDVPHNFPIRVKEGEREKLYFYLMDRGIPTIALYYRLIDQIKKEEFPLSYVISNEILNLPVHQDTSDNDVEAICNAIKEFYGFFKKSSFSLYV